jgi:hypothetical protein
MMQNILINDPTRQDIEIDDVTEADEKASGINIIVNVTESFEINGI